MTTRQQRLLWIPLVTLAGAWILVRLFRPAAVPVEVASVTTGPLLSVVGDEGQARVRHRHIITAPVAGRLERLGLEVGDSVRAGTVVARLAPLPLDARSRQQAEAALAAAQDRASVATADAGAARAALEQARRDRERGEVMLAGKAIAPAELERLQLAERTRARELDASEALAEAAAHDVEAARSALMASGGAAGLATLRLICPVGGRVLAIPERSERTVAPGETLLEIGDPADLEIVVDLLSTDAVRVHPGQRMLITGWGGDSVLDGRVRRVEPSAFTEVSALGVEEQRVNVVGDFVSAPARLGDRFRVDVQVVLWAGDSVRQLPASALFRRGDRWAVFLIRGGRAQEREVTIGHESPDATEILDGLAIGDIVVRHPTDQVRDGVRVKVRE